MPVSGATFLSIYGQEWQDTCRPFFQDYRKACQSFNMALRSDALLALLKLPQKALIRSRGGRGRAVRSLASQLSHVSSPAVSPIPAADRASLPLDPLLPKILRANDLISQGYVSKGVRSLLQDGLAPFDNKVFVALQSLHPPASEPVPPLPVDSPRLVVDPQILARIINTRLPKVLLRVTLVGPVR